MCLKSKDIAVGAMATSMSPVRRIDASVVRRAGANVSSSLLETGWRSAKTLERSPVPQDLEAAPAQFEGPGIE